jgi:hypothetical protein
MQPRLGREQTKFETRNTALGGPRLPTPWLMRIPNVIAASQDDVSCLAHRKRKPAEIFSVH